MSQGTRVTITPFNLPGSTLTEVAPPDTTDLPEQLVHRSSSLEDSPPLLRAVVSVPVGLSSKELARLRSLANESRSPPVDRQPSNTPLTTMIDRDVPEGAAVPWDVSSSTTPGTANGMNSTTEPCLLTEDLRTDEKAEELFTWSCDSCPRSSIGRPLNRPEYERLYGDASDTPASPVQIRETPIASSNRAGFVPPEI
ncbi:hypothetical protein EDB83DRAFT_2682193 [Lactarius deliciosus]|nr:hypothetical protein EDB83DRAFT_2682193 [Lactarius deliciosus]